MTPTPAWYEADSDDSDRNATDDNTASAPDAARGATDSDVHAPGVLGDVPPVSGVREARYAELVRGMPPRFDDIAAADTELQLRREAEQAELKAEVERVWRWFETDAATLRAEVDRLRAEKQRLSERAAQDVLAAESALTEAREQIERLQAEDERWSQAYMELDRSHTRVMAQRDNARRAAKESALNGVAEQRRAESAEAALTSEREAHAGLRARLERATGWIGSHASGCTVPDAPCACGVAGARADLRAILADATPAAPVAAEEGGEQEAGEGTHQRPGCTCGGISACLVCQEADEQEVGEAKVTWHRLVEVISSTLGCDIQAWQDRVTGEWDANCETCGANADEDGCLNAQRLATAVDRLLHTAPSGSDEQGNRPATPDANGVHDTKGGEGRG